MFGFALALWSLIVFNAVGQNGEVGSPNQQLGNAAMIGAPNSGGAAPPSGVVVLQTTYQNGSSGAPSRQPGSAPTSTRGNGSPGGPAAPSGFVVVQTSYLEQLAAAQKASLDAVATTSQSAINTAKANLDSVAATTKLSIEASEGREATLIHFVEILGGLLTVLAGVIGFFGFQKYNQVQEWLGKIEGTKNEIEETNKQVVARANDFAEKLGELEQLFTGMHSLSMKLDSISRSKQRKKEAAAELGEIEPLYRIAEKLGNIRVQSYLAASLSIMCMYAEQWSGACSYAKISIDNNPHKWRDRIYNAACVYAAKFKKMHQDADRVEAINLLMQYFQETQMEDLAVEIENALEDDDLASIRQDLKRMAAQTLDKAFDVACRYALKFAEKKNDIHKETAIELMRLHFKRKEGKITPAEIEAAIEEAKLASIKAEIEALNADHSLI